MSQGSCSQHFPVTFKVLEEMEAQFKWRKEVKVREGNEPGVNWWEIGASWRSRCLGVGRAEKECAMLASC